MKPARTLKREPLQDVLEIPAIITQINKALNYIKRLGLPQNPTSRLPQYLKAISSFYEAQSHVHDPFQIRLLLTAVSEGLILSEIALEKNRDHRWNSSLREILKGPIFPADQSDRPRDLQAEMYLITRLRMTGFPSKMMEPDIMVEFQDEEIAIAVKRPRYTRNISESVKKGLRQIENSNRTGLVALDLTVALAQHKTSYIAPTMTEATYPSDLIACSLQQRVREAASIVQSAQVTGIGGIIGVAHSTFVVAQTGRLGTHLAWRKAPNLNGPLSVRRLMNAFIRRGAGFRQMSTTK